MSHPLYPAAFLGNYFGLLKFFKIPQGILSSNQITFFVRFNAGQVKRVKTVENVFAFILVNWRQFSC